MRYKVTSFLKHVALAAALTIPSLAGAIALPPKTITISPLDKPTLKDCDDNLQSDTERCYEGEYYPDYNDFAHCIAAAEDNYSGCVSDAQ